MKNLVAGSAVTLFCLLTTPTFGQHPVLQSAWDAFNKAEDPRSASKIRLASYQLAVKLAEKCITDYAITATRTEADLEKKKVPDPPTGAVPAEQKGEILKRGPLNDAAACYFIQGRSNESLASNADLGKLQKKSTREEQNSAAKAAYSAGCKLQYARVWDPQGWFWKPADEMCERLSRLQKQVSQISAADELQRINAEQSIRKWG